jgi:hypothetical protein
MTSDPLIQLLHQADRAAGGPRAVVDDLPERVRQLARQRRRAKYQGSVAAIGLIVIAGVLIGPRLRGNTRTIATPNVNTAITVAALDQELLAIRTETEKLRAEILAAQPASVPTRARPPVTAPSVDEELERAAYLIVYQADRYHRELDMPASAITSYRQTIDLYPGTRAAQTARDRLCQIETTKGQPS